LGRVFNRGQVKLKKKREKKNNKRGSNSSKKRVERGKKKKGNVKMERFQVFNVTFQEKKKGYINKKVM